MLFRSDGQFLGDWRSGAGYWLRPILGSSPRRAIVRGCHGRQCLTVVDGGESRRGWLRGRVQERTRRRVGFDGRHGVGLWWTLVVAVGDRICRGSRTRRVGQLGARWPLHGDGFCEVSRDASRLSQALASECHKLQLYRAGAPFFRRRGDRREGRYLGNGSYAVSELRQRGEQKMIVRVREVFVGVRLAVKRNFAQPQVDDVTMLSGVSFCDERRKLWWPRK